MVEGLGGQGAWSRLGVEADRVSETGRGLDDAVESAHAPEGPVSAEGGQVPDDQFGPQRAQMLVVVAESGKATSSGWRRSRGGPDPEGVTRAGLHVPPRG